MGFFMVAVWGMNICCSHSAKSSEFIHPFGDFPIRDSDNTSCGVKPLNCVGGYTRRGCMNCPAAFVQIRAVIVVLVSWDI